MAGAVARNRNKGKAGQDLKVKRTTYGDTGDNPVPLIDRSSILSPRLPRKFFWSSILRDNPKASCFALRSQDRGSRIEDQEAMLISDDTQNHPLWKSFTGPSNTLIGSLDAAADCTDLNPHHYTIKVLY